MCIYTYICIYIERERLKSLSYSEPAGTESRELLPACKFMDVQTYPKRLLPDLNKTQ